MASLSQLIGRMSVIAVFCSLVLPAHAYTWVYRADRRPPSEVFANGFHSTGTRLNLLDHTFGFSCGNRGAITRSIWASSTHDYQFAHDFANDQMQSQRQLQNIWIYAIRPDASYFDVANVFNQVSQAAALGQAGYRSVHGRYMDYLVRTAANIPHEVVTQRIAPENIHSARLITRSADGQQVIQATTSTLNGAFTEPATQMTNHVDNLQTFVPSSELENYAQYIAGAWSCELECDGASTSRAERKRRSVEDGGPSCPFQPSKALRLIGSDAE